jgi:hypothetical protein
MLFNDEIERGLKMKDDDKRKYARERKKFWFGFVYGFVFGVILGLMLFTLAFSY